MCHFLAPAGQPEMMHKNFMLMPLRIFAVLMHEVLYEFLIKRLKAFY